MSISRKTRNKFRIMPTRTCEKCNKTFKFKDAYDKHMNRKIACNGTNMHEDIISLKQEIDGLKKVVLKIENNHKNINKTDKTNKMSVTNKFIKFINTEKSINQSKVNTKLLKQICDKFKIKYNAKKRTKKYYHDLLGDYFKDNVGELNLELFKVALYKEKKQSKKKEDDINEEKTEELVMSNNKGNAVVSCVNSCHNILRNNDSIVGEKAMHDIMRILFLKFIEPLITINHETGIDLLNVKYYKDDDYYEEGMEQLAKFSTFIENSTTDNDMKNNGKNLWKTILANHPMTKNIFKLDDFFNCKTTTLRLLIDKVFKTLSNSKFDDLDNDVKGKIYEEFLNGYNNNAGKSFGQYFTTRNYIKLIFNQILKETINSYKQKEQLDVLDPCMGTAGFLTETIKLFPNSILYGCEIESETYNYALMNLILTTGELKSTNFNCCDSIVKCKPLEKVDFIPTNPPYGTKMNYVDLSNKYKEEYKEQKVPEFKNIYPVKTNDGVALFLQLLVHKLKVGGLCIAIVPNGQILFGKNFTKLRKYIMSKCHIEKIIYAPGGVFKHAGVKTAVLYLIKTAGENKNMNIKFMETTKQLTEPKLIDTIGINAENNWSWDASYYKAQEIPDWGDCEWKPIGDICESKNGNALKKSNIVAGEFPVIGGGQKPMGYHNRFNTEANAILCSSSGAYSGYISKYTKRVWKSDCFSIKPNEKIINKMYIYLYLKYNQNKIYKFQTGAGQPHVYWNDLKKLKIPVPSLEVQQKIVDELEKLEKSKDLTKQQIQMMILNLEQYRKHTNPPFAKYKEQIKWKKLGDICEIKSGSLQSTKNINGDYAFITASKEFKTHNSYDYDCEAVVYATGSEGSLCNSFYVNGKFTASTLTLVFTKPKKSKLKYIKYYLDYNKKNILILFKKGSSKKTISKENLSSFKIPVPSLEVQQEFIKFYETKEQKINEILSNIQMLENHIVCMDDLGRNIIEDIISNDGSS